MAECDFHYCSNTATREGLCDQCYADEQRCLRGECDCCGLPEREYIMADEAYDMRGGATSDFEWYGGYMYD